jgi:ketosteroid isomerase-like protein
VAAFARGDPGPVERLFSHADDVTLANPFGPAVRGWDDVSAALEYASSRFADGDVAEIANLATYASDDLVTRLDIETWSARVGGGPPAQFQLWVTTTFRTEDGQWRIVSRHADPITTPSPEGPLRAR